MGMACSDCKAEQATLDVLIPPFELNGEKRAETLVAVVGPKCADTAIAEARGYLNGKAEPVVRPHQPAPSMDASSYAMRQRSEIAAGRIRA